MFLAFETLVPVQETERGGSHNTCPNYLRHRRKAVMLRCNSFKTDLKLSMLRKF